MVSFWPVRDRKLPLLALKIPIRAGTSLAVAVCFKWANNNRGGFKMRLVQKVYVGLLSVAVLVIASANADAQDSFDMTQNGRSYRCQATSPVPGTGSAVDCASRAYSGAFNREQSMRLCTGAVNTGPADCAAKAYSGAFNQEQAISLCTGAYNTGPVDCAAKAYSGPFNLTESMQLCSGIGTTAVADCATRAYAGPYSKEEAIRLCRSPQRPLIERALNQILGEEGTSPDRVIEKAFAKAAREKLDLK